MPELPEVEMRRRFVAEHALNQRIGRVTVSAQEVLSGIGARSLHRSLAGQCFDDTHRHGKWLFVHSTAGPWLVLHFGMTGNLRYYTAGDDVPKYVRVRFDFENGAHLAFTDPRKFGEVGLTDDVRAFLDQRHWGPDPTLPGFDRAAFRERLSKRKGALKSVLMNQRIIAGIGNLYADEMLFQTALHPDARVELLKRSTIDRLYAAMMEIFETALAVETNYEALPDSFLLRHRNYSGECPKCGGRLTVWKAGGRTGYFCHRHQRRRS